MTAQGIVTTGTILDRILARTATDVALRKAALPSNELEARIASMPAPLGMTAALSQAGLSLIAEIKRASPSKGRFPIEIDAPGLALEYAEAGADAISVLTDEPFFEGSVDDLVSAAARLNDAGRSVPLLRKDFILDDYQVLEARAYGASAVLLIVAALDDRTLIDLLQSAEKYGIEALVEVHDESELERAANAGARLIGVNNRNLHTFDVDLAVSERLAKQKPAGCLMIGESGIFNGDDAERMAAAGMDGILVGESLVVASDRAGAILELKQGGERGLLSTPC